MSTRVEFEINSLDRVAAQNGSDHIATRPCPLLRVKRTCRFALHMSAFDPKRTLVASRPPPSRVLVYAATMLTLSFEEGNETA
jgi:hypothetical protein